MAALTLFFDRSTGRKLPRLLKSAEPPFEVEFHDDKKHGFNERTPDDEWLALVGRNGWTAISHDKRFHRDSLAVAAIREHRTAVFYLDGGSYPLWFKVKLIARSSDRITEICATEKRPFIWHIRDGGRVSRLRETW